jgi:hypothetical protein
MQVEEATEADCEKVLPLLAGFNNSSLTADRWRCLFNYTWPAPSQRRGFLLRDGDRVGGYFATVWSERTIDGKREAMCNLSSWITLPEYRNLSLLLFKAVTEPRNCTLTCHSPAGRIYPLFRKFGFQDLETQWRLILPYPSWDFSAWFGYHSTTNPDRIAEIVNPADREILQAHRCYRCGHLLIHGRNGYCYLIFTKTKGRRTSFAHLQYISDRQVFLRQLDRIRLRLFLATGTPFVMVDSRLVKGLEIPHSREVTLSRPYVYRSETLRAEQIDNLYSEIILLGL